MKYEQKSVRNSFDPEQEACKGNKNAIQAKSASVSVIKYLDYLRRINCHPARRLNEVMRAHHRLKTTMQGAI